MSSTATTTAPSGGSVPSDVLTGPGAEDLLVQVLAAEGADLVSWDVHHVDRRAGGRVTVGYDLLLRAQPAASIGHGPPVDRREYLVATNLPVPASDVPGRVTVRADDGVATVWRHPADPFLPGLRVACTPSLVADRLPGRAAVESVEIVAYRPTRRAVVRVVAGGVRHYVKVLRPDRLRAVVVRHDLLDGSRTPRRGAPVGPSVLAAHDDGLLVLADLPGTSVARALADGREDALDPAGVLSLLAGLPRAVTALPARPSAADRLPELARAAESTEPTLVAALHERVAEGLRRSDAGPVVATHGDLSVSNLLLEIGRQGAAPRGLLDLDTLGPGHLVDDLACLVGHLAVLPALDPVAYRRAPALLGRCVTVFGRVVDPLALRARAAAVVLSLVPGAPDDERARAWLRAALELVDETALTRASCGSHTWPQA